MEICHYSVTPCSYVCNKPPSVQAQN